MEIIMQQRISFPLLILGLVFSLVLSSCAPAAANVPTAPATVAAAEPTPTSAPKEPVNFVNPQKYSIEYSVTIKNDGFNPSEIRLYLPVPGEWDAQKEVVIKQISPDPNSQAADANSGNAMIYWKLSGSPKINTSQQFILNFDLTAYETNTHIDPAAVLPYNKGSEEFKLYTKPEKYIESSDPKIVELAQTLAAGETNPYLLAKKFYDYIIDHTQYKILGKGLNGAKYLLDNGVGECGDYSALFIALSRASGIPARPVVGYWAISGNDQTHVWAEFYLEGLGWIPVDATIGQQSKEKRAYYFGNMDNQRVILSKGYNTALVPAGPDGYVAPILQVPMWWYWGSGDASKISMNRNWSVSKNN